MNWRNRQRARVLSEYIDSLIVQRRTEQSRGEAESDDRESSDLRALCAELSRIEIRTPPDLADDLALRIARTDTQAPPAGLLTTLKDRFERWHSPDYRLTSAPSFRIAAATLIATLVMLMYRSPARTVSAAEVLTKAQAALAEMVRPGEVMFRRWRIVDRIREKPGAPERVETRYLAEWMDGGDSRRAAGRSFDANGRLYLAYVNDPKNDTGFRSPVVYYAPGFSGEPRGLLSIVPTVDEFQSAAARLPERLQPAIFAYLARGFVPYQPIMGELRYNEAVLESRRMAQDSPAAPVDVSLETTTIDKGRRVYRLRFVDPLRVLFRWTSEGPPNAWLARYEVVRFIDVETFLNVRTETVEQHESGRQIVSSRELIETRVVEAPFSGENPFELPVHSDVVTRRQSAFDHLTQVGRTLDRAPEFSAAIRTFTTTPDQR